MTVEYNRVDYRNMDSINVYTDGSWIPGQDGRGYAGMGIWFGVDDPRNESISLSGNHITHQYAELKSIEVALKYCRFISYIEIKTDSKYSIDCVMTWSQTWEKNGWVTSKGTPVLHSDLIKSILKIIRQRSSSGMSTDITHVRGHKGLEGNEGADKLAHGAAKRLELARMSKVHYFDGGALSNFYFCDLTVEYAGTKQKFNCVEQFYQYHKALKFADIKSASNILASGSQYIQKNLGRSIHGFNKDIWDQCKEDVMMYGVRQKFKQHAELAQKLLSTGSSIIAEARPDKEWGIGISCGDAVKGVKWNGKNLLGKVLMDVRDELSKE